MVARNVENVEDLAIDESVSQGPIRSIGSSER